MKLYRDWLVEQIEQGYVDIEPLKGKQLSCWCSLEVACHADVLCELANQQPTLANYEPDHRHTTPTLPHSEAST